MRVERVVTNDRGGPLNIVGLNLYHGDVSAVVIAGGRLVAALEEERFRRIKHYAGVPRDAMLGCLAMAGLTAKAVDHFAVSRNPRAHLVRKALFALRKPPRIGLVRDRVRNAARVRNASAAIAAVLDVSVGDVKERLHFIEHHPAHLASTFFVSPFEEAAVCALDGFGDFVSTSCGVGRGSKLEVQRRVYFPHSLGLLYLALTQYLGFVRFGDEYKVMGLAPYGGPDYVGALRKLIRLKPDGGFALDLSYFLHWSDGASMTWDDGEPTIGQVFSPKLEALLGPARRSDEGLTARHEAIAASLQVVFEEAAFHVLNAVARETRLSRLCLAGGCALNSVMNGKIRERTPFQEIYIQPAAGDNGTALGAAYYVWHHVLRRPREFVMEHAYWGTEFDEAWVEAALAERRSELERVCAETRKLADEDELCRWGAEQIEAGKVIGWFQGRMEWGARALGNRSILADPRRPDMRDIINVKVKLREKFRPFAPSILEEALAEFFLDATPDPFMIQVYRVRPEKTQVIPAVTHVDGTGRLQTVSRQGNPLYWRLIKAFEKRTGVPVLLNTSFNENEPIVQRPEEAIDCFVRTGIDALALGRVVVEKGESLLL